MRVPLFRFICLVLLGLRLATPAQAASQGCLIDDPKKVCATMNWAPQTAQPSQQDGTKTYVRFDVTIVNVTSQSTRFLVIDEALAPATAFVSFTADPRATCGISGATLHCDVDKLEAGEPMTVSAVAETPSYETTFTDTATYGWQGRTSTVSGSVPITQTSGESWQQPNEAVRLSTEKPAADPSQQTSPDDPVYGEVLIPGSPNAGQVFIRIITDGPDRSAVCPGDIYLDLTGDGGPFVCRDTSSNGNPRRWVQVGAPDNTVPMQIKVIEDASIVPAIQLPPVPPLLPTGTPPFAMFAHADAATAPFRAIDETCSTHAPPCLLTVERYSTGDWTATLATQSVNLGDPPVLIDLGGVGIFGLLPPIGNFQ